MYTCMQSQLYKAPLRFHSELAGGLLVAFVNFVIGSLEIEFFDSGMLGMVAAINTASSNGIVC